MKNLYPLKLAHASSSAIWGGEKLKTEWGKKSELSPLAETWELSVRDDGKMSLVENGEFAGRTLEEYINSVGASTVSSNYAGDRFPLLIKFIDAAKDLSVQVHPNDEYAARYENDLGKTEMWYIVDAEEGAEIISGLSDGVTAEDFKKAVKSNDYSSVLRRVKVHAGECYFIPAGLAHAIGGGVLIAEIQQNSDLTYRIYDYDRVGADGKKRELHVEQAMQVVRPFSDEEIEKIRFSKGKMSEEQLANGEFFSVSLLKIEAERTLEATPESFHCLLSVAGEAILTHGGEDYKINRGDAYFIPAAAGEYTLRGTADILLSTL